MQATATQRESIQSVRSELTDLTQQQRIVMLLDRHGPAIRDDIAYVLDMRTSSVTARLNELVKSEEIRVTGTRWNAETSRNVSVYALV